MVLSPLGLSIVPMRLPAPPLFHFLIHSVAGASPFSPGLPSPIFLSGCKRGRYHAPAVKRTGGGSGSGRTAARRRVSRAALL